MSTVMDQRMSATEAMTISSREDRIVHLPYSEVLHNALLESCDDHATTGDAEEFWGVDWRVHLVNPLRPMTSEEIEESGLTEAAIRQLREEAGTAGDDAMVRTCTSALAGDRAAVALVLQAIK